MLITPRGLHDLFGNKLQKFQSLISLLKKHVSTFGYTEIQTPTFEYVETFLANDLDGITANKELFYLEGKKYVLRPENTAAIVRAVISNKLLSTQEKPISFFYVGSMYRHERPQEGRYREFVQFGLEKLSCESIYHELEIIQLIDSLLKTLGLKCQLKLNYLGPNALKQECNQRLSEHFAQHKDELSELSQKRIHTNPLRIFDDSLDTNSDVCIKASEILNIFYENAKDEIELIRNTLNTWGIPYLWDPKLVRGIDYYTGLVYEWEFDGLTIIAGGRYDELFEKFKHPKVPSIGLAIGINRLVEALDKISYRWSFDHLPSVYIINLNVDYDTKLHSLIQDLRSSGICIHMPWSSKKMKDHFKASERLNVDYLLIYGEQERANSQVVLKKQHAQEQTTFNISDLKGIIKFINQQTDNV